MPVAMTNPKLAGFSAAAACPIQAALRCNVRKWAKPLVADHFPPGRIGISFAVRGSHNDNLKFNRAVPQGQLIARLSK